MKLPKSKKALVLLTTTVMLVTISTPAFANSLIGDTFSNFVKAQKITIFDIPLEKIAGYVQSDGTINMNSVFTDFSKRALEWIKGNGNGGDVASVKTAGEQMADFNQDRAEIIHQSNTQSTAQTTKHFQDNAENIQQVVKASETPSDSSLEAADKNNKLASANVLTNQQLTKATLDLALAQQNQNSLEIEKGQIARTDRLKSQINSGFFQNEVERLQTVARRRFYPDASGQMVEGNADPSTKVFNGK